MTLRRENNIIDLPFLKVTLTAVWRIDWEMGKGGWRLENRSPVERNVETEQEMFGKSVN